VLQRAGRCWVHYYHSEASKRQGWMDPLNLCRASMLQCETTSSEHRRPQTAARFSSSAGCKSESKDMDGSMGGLELEWHYTALVNPPSTSGVVVNGANSVSSASTPAPPFFFWDRDQWGSVKLTRVDLLHIAFTSGAGPARSEKKEPFVLLAEPGCHWRGRRTKKPHGMRSGATKPSPIMEDSSLVR
jgi:hypothetical protein